ncbi:hypothetical protein BDA96_02G192600 [Sorghum bicolor]|uniref:Uncharacterized protein n=1 Tax=Sorghum bicolor TaxID=4558 RepID=A0A921UVX8_SORBI|nr:hypothetical protein BDA96_02G192600 [Sorghum bicolor]
MMLRRFRWVIGRPFCRVRRRSARPEVQLGDRRPFCRVRRRSAFTGRARPQLGHDLHSRRSAPRRSASFFFFSIR